MKTRNQTAYKNYLLRPSFRRIRVHYTVLIKSLNYKNSIHIINKSSQV
jgi:hypothetical protein